MRTPRAWRPGGHSCYVWRTDREGIAVMVGHALRDRRNTISAHTDTQRWAAFTRAPWCRPPVPPERASYLPDGRHEVAAMAGRIAGSMAVVLAFGGGFA